MPTVPVIQKVAALEGWTIRVTCRDGSTWERDLTALVEGDRGWGVLAEDERFEQVEVTDRGLAVGWPAVRRYLDIPIWKIMEKGKRVDG